MPNKKFKLSKKQGVYTAAGVVLVGTLAAAAITSPGLLHNVFDPKEYSFDDARNNGNTAYNTAANANGDGDKNSNVDSNAAANEPNDSKEEKKENISKADSKDRSEEQRDKEEQHKAPENALRDSSYVNKGSSNEESRGVGTDKNGYALINTGRKTEVASSTGSTGNNIVTDSDNIVDMIGDNGNAGFDTRTETSPSPLPEQHTPVPQPTQPSATRKPEVTAKPSPTRIPSNNEKPWSTPSPTKRPSGGSSGGGNSSNNNTPAPSNNPTANPTGVPTDPTANPTQAPTPEPTQVPTREPMPTAEPDTKPADAVNDNKQNGNTVEVSKGGVGITDHHGGGSSMSSGGATKIDFTKFTSDQTNVEYIQIASSVKTINFEKDKLLFPNLKGYIVSPNNKYYQSIDGVLYSKDGKILYACPAKLESISSYPSQLEKIYDSAFIGSQMKNIDIPDTVTTVSSKAFSQANIESLTFEGDNLTLGAEAFYNSAADGLSVKKLIFKSKTPPTVTNNSALTFKDPNTGLDKSGMIIQVPDSDGDKVLQDYIKAWGETIDGVYGSGMTSYLINTENNAGKNYSFENNALYKKPEKKETPSETETPSASAEPGETISPSPTDAPEETDEGLTLLYVAPSTRGEFTPQANTSKIAAGAFEGCSKITVINLPITITELENGCFKGLDGLTSIVVAGTVPAKVGEEVWKDIDPNEVSIYVSPDEVENYISQWGEAIDKALGAGSAQKIIKGSSTSYKYIDGALYSITADGKILVDAPHTDLDNFRIADGTIEIAAGAFGSKYTYSYVFIPNTVTKIDKEAFASTKIGILVMTAENPPELPDGIDLSGITTVYVPSGSLDKYKEAWGNCITDIQAPAINYASESHAIYGINEDNTYSLFNLPVVASGTFTMLDNVREVAERALADCVNVEEINFSVLIEKIGKEAFINNTSLKGVDISRLTELKDIPERVFYGDTAMTQMQLPVLIETLGDEFAAENTSLANVNFNKLTKLKSIGKKAFYNDTSLEEVTLVASMNLKSIGESAFENCSSVKSARLPINIEVLSSKLFKNASSLARISFSSGLKEIGDEALYGTALKTLNFDYNSNLEKIGEGAFAENKELTSLILPEKLTIVSASLAKNDTALTNVTLSKKTEEISDEAFAGNEALTEIDIPAAIKKIGSKVFEGCDKLVKIIVRAIEPPELGEKTFGNEKDGMSVYVPDNSYDDYIAKWNGDLYNKASSIIKKLSEIEPENPDITPEPTQAPTLPPIPTARPLPSISPILPSTSPEASDEPNETAGPSASPDASSEPNETAEPSTSPETSDEPNETAEPSASPEASSEPNETAEPKQTEQPKDSTDSSGGLNSEQPEGTSDNSPDSSSGIIPADANSNAAAEPEKSGDTQEAPKKESVTQEPDKSSSSASSESTSSTSSSKPETKSETKTEVKSEVKTENKTSVKTKTAKTGVTSAAAASQTSSKSSTSGTAKQSSEKAAAAKSETPKQKEQPVKKAEEPKSAPPSKETTSSSEASI